MFKELPILIGKCLTIVKNSVYETMTGKKIVLVRNGKKWEIEGILWVWSSWNLMKLEFFAFHNIENGKKKKKKKVKG